MLDEFSIVGPNGNHLCLVGEPARLTISVSEGLSTTWKFPIEFYRSIPAQLIAHTKSRCLLWRLVYSYCTFQSGQKLDADERSRLIHLCKILVLFGMTSLGRLANEALHETIPKALCSTHQTIRRKRLPTSCTTSRHLSDGYWHA